MSISKLLKTLFIGKPKVSQWPAANEASLNWVLEVACAANSVHFDAALVAPRLKGATQWLCLESILPDLNISIKRSTLTSLQKLGLGQQALVFLDKDKLNSYALDTSFLGSVSNDASTPEEKTSTSEHNPASNEAAPSSAVKKEIISLKEFTHKFDQKYVEVIVLQSQEGKVLILVKDSTSPIVLEWSDFESLFSPYVYKLSKIYGENEKPPQVFGYGWLATEMWKYKAVWRDVVIASVFIQLIALLLPLMTQTIIDKVITNRTISTLEIVIAGLIVGTLFSTALSWVRQYLVLHTGNKVDATLGSRVFGHLLRLPLPYFETRPTGTLVTRLHGVETIRDFITGTFVTIILDIPSMLVFFIIMLYYSPLLSMVSISVALLMAIISFFVAPLLRNKTNEQYMAGAKVQSFSTEYIAGMETVKSLQMETTVEAQYSQYMAEYMQKGFEAKQVSNTYNTFMNLLDQISNTAILGIGAYLAMTDAGFTIGMLVAFQMFSGKVTQPLLRLSGLWQQFQQANIALKRLGDVMNVPVERYAYIPSSVRTAAPQIEIKDLSFSYSADRQPLYENLSFKILAGQCVAIVGPSGCGKSTIAKLLQGFYGGYKGQITIGDRELRTIAVNELRTWFGVVPQETMLFSGTISDNLQAANSRATLEQMVHVCKLAGVHDAIEKLPNGYMTEIGERGVGLSGGQKQRLAIARALLKGAKVLIFDESTANLDQASAHAVAETVNALKGRLTLIFVAHHMPANLKVDRVIKLPEGVDLPLRQSPATSLKGGAALAPSASNGADNK